MYAKRRRAAPNAESQRTRADQDSQKRPGEFTVELNYPETLVVKTKGHNMDRHGALVCKVGEL